MTSPYFEVMAPLTIWSSCCHRAAVPRAGGHFSGPCILRMYRAAFTFFSIRVWYAFEKGRDAQMLHDGRYSVWFKTAEVGGVGVIELANRRMSGRGTALEYSGSFTQDGNRFSATVSTRRHSPGQPSLFGIDELDFEFDGKSGKTTAICIGTARQLPDIPLEVVLVRIAD